MSEKEEKKISDIAKREEAILAFWQREGIFQKSLEKESPKGEYVFYDGPPFATGLPHHGHMLPSTIKDAIPRYRTMQGYHVKRTWGWDCHGLPLENLIEKKLGLATKRDIEALGVEKFNQACADAVMEYADDWKKIIPRIGRWADMDNDYKTMDSSYTESVWWVFAELNRKGLVYEGFKSMHLCPRCGTTLSNFEVNQGYKDIKDIAVTVKLKLDPGQAIGDFVTDDNTHLLVWTTTPWTLPGNMAAAVHKEFDYVRATVQRLGVEIGTPPATQDVPEYVILAKSLFEKYQSSARSGGEVPVGGDISLRIVQDLKGSNLVGKSYLPPFEYYAQKEKTPGIHVQGSFENAWKIYHADYVTLDSGTGAVHLAPAYGEEDMVLGQREGIPVVHHVDGEGHFMAHITDLAGRAVKPKDDEKNKILHTDADVEVLKMLKENGRLFAKENIVHSYPHCWRCETPLLNYATSSWFVRVTDIKDKLVSENSKIGWVPEHIGSARFGNWLLGARDWAVSRQRYWGAPLPVWKNKKAQTYKVLGSLEELMAYVPKSGNQYFLMRHGESESNVAHVLNSDPLVHNPLTEKGRAQIEKALERIPDDIDLVIYSPLERAKETASYIIEKKGVSIDKVICDARIRELGMGMFEGKAISEKDKAFPTPQSEFTDSVEGTETLRELTQRMGDFLYELESKHQGKKILIISHGDALWMAEALAQGADMEKALELGKNYMANAEVRQLDFTPLPHNRNFELDFHRPYIDEIELVDTDGEKLVRVPDVFDCWFESGSMPYGQQHYPFENQQIFDPEKGVGYPADFISESVDQTRGWFYSMIVLGTALFGQSPYKNVITNGLVLAEDGRKMSKSLKNYPDLMDVVDVYGADTLRFFLLSSQVVRGEDVNFSEKNLAELSRKNIGRLANVLSFYELYKEADISAQGAQSSTNVLDRWIRARLNEVVVEVTEGMEKYELDHATRPITGFIDDLSVWYLRRSRERLKYGSEEDQKYTLATLRFVLKTLSLVMAPSMPFFAEHVFQAVREEADVESVHLASWPEVAERGDTQILSDMQKVRDVVTVAFEARNEVGIKVRQPLQSLRIREEVTDTSLQELIKDEVNVKEIVVDTALETPVVLDATITPELMQEGEIRDLMRHIQELRKTAGLSPQDHIVLTIDTDSEGQEAVTHYRDMLVRTVNATEVLFGASDGDPLVLERRSYRVSLA